MRRQHHAHGFFLAIGQHHRVADALAVEKHIGFGGDTCALQLFGHHGQAFFFAVVLRVVVLAARAARSFFKLPAMRMRKALSLMNPPASAWL